MRRIGAPPRRVSSSMVVLLLLALGGCGDQPPTGQVLATVAGEDVTRRDVAVELQEAPISGPGARAQTLENVIDRDLLVRVAKRRRLDVSPEYLGSLRRTRAMLLTTQLEDVLGAELEQPSPAQIAAYIAAYPMIFGKRERVLVDQLVIPVRGGDRERLNGAATIDAAVRLLGTAGREIHRTTATFDTATIPEDLAHRLADSAIGRPIILSEPGHLRVVAVTDRASIAITGAQAVSVAREVMRRRQLDAKLATLLAEERRRTEIRYQAGTGPAAP